MFAGRKLAAIATLIFIFAVVAAAAQDPSSSVLERKYAPNPSLQANVAFRVLFALVGTALCWVPFRLLWRNGDFAAVVLILDVALMNFFTVLNALIWRGDNWDNWWTGEGLCDVEVYLAMPLETIYAAAIFAVVYQLAQHVRLTRASAMNRKERTRRALVQAAVIFPIPLFQALFTWFDLAQRYRIGAVVGCMPVFDNSWPRFVVYDSPNPLFVMASVPFASKCSTSGCLVSIPPRQVLITTVVLTFKRFRAFSKSTRDALRNSNTSATRANRTRFRLYNMTASILVVYFPVSVYFFAYNVQQAATESLKPYSYRRIHWEASPYPWNAILLMPSWTIPTVVLNQPWISIATTVVIVAFFGTTKDGVDMYREFAVKIGLARCFPKLAKPAPRVNPEDTQNSWTELLDRRSKGAATGR
ncbi:hypothetical protein M426DRAFT_217178 [Hypoxylon sp. CI-4A]|nr:hypothetical protein M426DRAFT_217178 [Hypoxylon sp. CI-4A]